MAFCTGMSTTTLPGSYQLAVVQEFISAGQLVTVVVAPVRGATSVGQGAVIGAAQGDGMTALHWAAERGDAELAQLLIYAGANVSAVTRIGLYTPLHLAAKSGNAAVASVLGAWYQAGQSLLQLGINLIGITIAGVLTLVTLERRRLPARCWRLQRTAIV